MKPRPTEEVVQQLTDDELKLAYFEIKEWRSTGVLPSGVLRTAHEKFEKITETDQNLRITEDAILLEVARRKFE
jgi:hypothetical protein